MAHTIRDKVKLLARIRRIKGQVEGIERALESEDKDCDAILQNVTACRGALNSLMFEIIEGHVHMHVLPSKHTAEQEKAADILMEVVRAYLK